MVKWLECVLPFERIGKNLAILEQRFPGIRVLARSSFFVVCGCEVVYTEEDKQWLLAMKDAQVIEKFRCKERTDR